MLRLQTWCHVTTTSSARVKYDFAFICLNSAGFSRGVVTRPRPPPAIHTRKGTPSISHGRKLHFHQAILHPLLCRVIGDIRPFCMRSLLPVRLTSASVIPSRKPTPECLRLCHGMSTDCKHVEAETLRFPDLLCSRLPVGYVLHAFQTSSNTTYCNVFSAQFTRCLVFFNWSFKGRWRFFAATCVTPGVPCIASIVAERAMTSG